LIQVSVQRNRPTCRQEKKCIGGEKMMVDLYSSGKLSGRKIAVVLDSFGSVRGPAQQGKEIFQ
jgi:hypothetical protein